ncbi:(2Fe-2S)-binding protein [Breznakiella homolactica]|uniref:2Fe-2S iron-sulfur cluster binding domain-containing protein n=1 Tax=Breznakiella homolactica TaxID=2798577 RepID=A0A7T7XKJ8_9SPIR|nr:2Fe-2S iron-sulfur cluster-binding protein [Breznakiella homolactica]QQO08051.1 2Fe-2S iron-sulfur cluster binding domain-containing protein [Breznakiella homolactica]
MTIGFILNGEDVTVQTEADYRLVDILRTNFGLLGAKDGCLTGRCGVCSVMYNEKIVPSCMIPAFKVRGSEIVTIEGFAQTVEFQDIIAGFSKAGVKTCGYCDTAKILAVEAFLGTAPRPSRDEIPAAFDGIICRCTEPAALVEGVLAASEIRQRRLYGRSS